MRITTASRVSGIPRQTLKNYILSGLISATNTPAEGIEIDPDSLMSFVKNRYGHTVKGRKVTMFPPDVVKANLTLV